MRDQHLGTDPWPCPRGQERVREFYSRRENRRYEEYRYRAPDGALFSCVRPTLAQCQAARNTWLVERMEAAQRERQAAREDARMIRHEEAEGRLLDWQW